MMIIIIRIIKQPQLQPFGIFVDLGGL